MVQMTAADQAVVRALPGNRNCVDCNRGNPDWASVSFGTLFCLDCSGVHRSLGVHISFVRSVAMDSWTQEQLELMKVGGNAACNNYLKDRGIASDTPIKAKYESDAAQLYKEVLKARAKGLPEPTSLPKKAPRTNTGVGAKSMAPAQLKAGEDPNGMERLTGETDEQYIARQTRLRDEARARMAAKFGSGGLGTSSGAQRMGGIGSDPSYDPNGGYADAFDLDGMKNSLVSGIGSAWSTLEVYGRQASNKAQLALNDPNLKENIKSTGVMDLWSSVSSAAQTVASKITEPDEDDGLTALQAKMREEQESRQVTGGADANRTSRYSGFGSDDLMGSRTSQVGALAAKKLDNDGGWNGEFDTFNQNKSASQSAPSSGNAVTIPKTSVSAPPSGNFTTASTTSVAKETTTNPNNGGSINLGATKMKLDNTGDDFFSSFGA